MMLRTGSSSFFSKRMSRLVTMPTSWPPSTTGTPEMLRARVSLITSPMVVSGPTVNGSRITPASKFLTLATSAACVRQAHVLVEDADAAELGHGDGQARFGDGVHGRGDDRQVERMSRVSCVREADVLGQDDRMRGDEGDVVEREGFSLDAQHGAVPRIGSEALYPVARAARESSNRRSDQHQAQPRPPGDHGEHAAIRKKNGKQARTRVSTGLPKR